MAVRKTRLSKPSKSSGGLNFKVRFDFGKKVFGIFTKKRKLATQETFNNHADALAKAIELNNGKKN